MTKSKKEKIKSMKMKSTSSRIEFSGVVETPDFDITKKITREKVAEYLKVSIQTVINYTNRVLFVAHKIGRRVLYNEDEVRAAIQCCAVKRYLQEATRLYIFNKNGL